jgi:uncharacterized protein Usg
MYIYTIRMYGYIGYFYQFIQLYVWQSYLTTPAPEFEPHSHYSHYFIKISGSSTALHDTNNNCNKILLLIPPPPLLLSHVSDSS